MWYIPYYYLDLPSDIVTSNLGCLCSFASRDLVGPWRRTLPPWSGGLEAVSSLPLDEKSMLYLQQALGAGSESGEVEWVRQIRTYTS